MWHVELTQQQSAIIEGLINTFSNHAPENLQWQLPFMQQHRALPLYIGWTETTAITPSGDIILWSTEPGHNFITQMDKQLFRMSLMQGVKRFPNLSFLIPIRPESATTCDVCLGTGTIQHELLSKVICSCGGVGWID